MTQVRHLWFIPQNMKLWGQQTISFVLWLCSKNPLNQDIWIVGIDRTNISFGKQNFTLFWFEFKIAAEQMSHKHTSKRLILDRKSELCLGLNPNVEIKETPEFEQILSFHSCQSPELELSPVIECERVDPIHWLCPRCFYSHFKMDGNFLRLTLLCQPCALITAHLLPWSEARHASQSDGQWVTRKSRQNV